LTDHLGSPRLVVNTATGAVAQRMEFDEFGRVLVDTSPGFTPFGFAGGLYDHDTGLVRFGAREYGARVGRWTAKDPILLAGGLNLYAYVDGDPVNRSDPNGRFWWIAAGAAVGAGADLGLQLYGNGGDFGNVDWGEVALGGTAGALFGAGGEFVFGTAFSGMSSSGSLVAVTQWGGAAAEGSPWVMLGGNTLRNYLLSGVVQLGYPRAGSATWYVNEAELAFPHGWEWIKGLWGQRIYCPMR
jgi:RHS repeat-associated protein